MRIGLRNFIRAAALTAIGVAMAGPAFADNTTAANAREFFQGQVQAQDFASNSERWYKAPLVAGRSYTLVSWAPLADGNAGNVAIGSDIFLNDGVTPAGASGVVIFDDDPEPSVEAVAAGGNNGDQTRIIAPTTGVYRFRVQNAAASTTTIDVMLVETTLFSPWYFAASGYDGYITIRNNTSSNAYVRVTVYSASGSVINFTTVNIPGNGNTFMTASSLGAASSGSVSIAHGTSQNGISANITTLNAATGLSFDAPFTPRIQ